MGRDMVAEGQRLPRSDVEGGKGRSVAVWHHLLLHLRVGESYFVGYLQQHVL